MNQTTPTEDKVPSRIEKKVVLRASKARVWRAISDSKEFGTWFGMKFDAPFIAGKAIRGTITPTKVDPDVAEFQKPYEGIASEFQIDKVEHERELSFRWHPGAVEPNVDYSSEPMTQVVFMLDDAPDGVLLTITESGFDKIPLARRAATFAGNDEGWTAQTKLIQKYLAQFA